MTADTHADDVPKSESELPCALQFITINDKGDSFELKEEVLQKVLDAVPEDMPISVVCVVGAFRTGKSFIMDLFLRYLRSTNDPDRDVEAENKDPCKAHEAWLLADGATLEGIFDDGKLEEELQKKAGAGFSWRPGTIRNTTGMWIWSQPFIRKNPLYHGDASGEPEEVAILLVDTQGMFDMMTAQMLTAAIFGLSTLISSYLVYNVEKRIQEDNLQHLALFTEYGRIALSAMEENTKSTSVRQPFQTLQFLVRDFQDFDDDDDVEACVADMEPYLNRVLESASVHKDLAEVRSHINMCFEKPSVFMLPHPGSEVPKKKYTGDLRLVNPAFCALVHRLAVSIFGMNSNKATEALRKLEKGAVVKKRVGEHPLAAHELMNYVRNYVKVFHEAVHGEGVFPEAKTLLAATAEANNYNAMELNVKRYKTAMDQVCGSKQKYVTPDKIEECHEQTMAACFQHYDRMASMGPREKILEFRERLHAKLLEMYDEYVANNQNKRPDILRFITILLILSAITYLSASIINIFCWPPATLPFDFEYADMCNATMYALRDIYLTTFFFIVLTFVTNCWNQIVPMLQLVSGQAQAKSKKE